MKKFLTILLLLTATLPAAAQHMLIEKGGSNNEIVSLDKFRQMTFSGTTVTIEQTDGTKSSAEMSAISTISFGDYTAIEQIKPGRERLVAHITGDAIAVNAKAGSTVTIYNVAGNQILSTRLGTDCGSISLAGLPKGIYIIEADNRTAKIIRQ